jgi:CheY-like chemotaxis protein
VSAAGVASPARILLVEDEAANRALFRAILEHSPLARLKHATVVEAGSLKAARLALETAQFDVVLLDVRLPDGNGLDLTDQIAAIDEVKRPRVAIVSASVLPAERAAAIESGADAFLGKPYRPADVAQLLTSLLRTRRRC